MTKASDEVQAVGELESFCNKISLEICKSLYLQVQNCLGNPKVQGPSIPDKIIDCGPAIVHLLWRQAKVLCRQQGDWKLLDIRLNDLISLANEKFYAYPFKDVPECWRRLFTDANILKACSLMIGKRFKIIEREDIPSSILINDSDIIDSVVKSLDLAIIMAGATGADRREWIDRIMELLELHCASSCAIGEERPAKRRKVYSFGKDGLSDALTVFIPPVKHPVARAVLPSFNEFEKHMKATDDQNIGPRPLIMEGVMEHWPARNERSWKRPSYLLSRTLNGRRLVPVEVGRSYVDEGWGQKVISFREFLSCYLFQSHSIICPRGKIFADQNLADDDTDEESPDQSRRTGYLAQHDLFTQIPSLRLDISVPDYCYTIAPPPHPSSPLARKHSIMPTLEEPLLNAWLGPAGTISPLHVDPYHNILAQVVGKKYIRLYAPGESEKLYPRGIEDGGVDMCNTSALDIGVLEGWDGTREDQKDALLNYPLYDGAEYADLILEEGECLYIPLGWWHYVRSLSVSFSVSFWWN